MTYKFGTCFYCHRSNRLYGEIAGKLACSACLSEYQRLFPQTPTLEHPKKKEADTRPDEDKIRFKLN